MVNTIDRNKIYNSDCRTGLLQLPDACIDCCVTSPPYFGLRNYGNDAQIGLEQTPEEYVSVMVQVFEQVRRVLKPEGTLWLNLGDSYNGSWGNYGGGNRGNGSQREIKNGSKLHQKGYDGEEKRKPATANKIPGLKPKDLIGIPWMVAFALRSAGWYLRQDIIWSKPNPMPESVNDRCTKAHEYIFMLSKQQRYYYDAVAIKTPMVPHSANPSGFSDGTKKDVMLRQRGKKTDKQRGHSRKHAGFNERWDSMTKEEQSSNGANKRSVWQVATKPFKEAHFATYPPELITPCILAGCPQGGIVLDPFMGAGTTAVTARKLNRDFIGFDLNKYYITIAEKRLHNALGLFNTL